MCGGNIGKLVITLGELDRAVEGHQSSSRIVPGKTGALPLALTYKNSSRLRVHVSDQTETVSERLP